MVEVPRLVRNLDARVTVLSVLPNFSMVYNAVVNGKPAITDGRFLVITEDAPRELVKQFNKIGVASYGVASYKVYDGSRFFDASKDKPLSIVGYLIRYNKYTICAVLSNDRLGIKINADCYRFFAKKGFTFSANLDDTDGVVRILKGKEPVAVIKALCVDGESPSFLIGPWLKLLEDEEDE